jgi:lycopene cyclase CruA
MSFSSVVSPHKQPDLSELRRHYPLTVTNFGALADREMWLHRICITEAQWQERTEKQLNGKAQEVILRGAPPSNLSVEETFDIIYAGSQLGLLHAAVMACKYERRVMIFDEGTSAKATPNWNVSTEDLKEFNLSELLTENEIEEIILNKSKAGFVKFHDAASCVKAPPLWMNEVLDLTLDGDKLLAIASRKFRC